VDPVPETKPKRADALRNREQILNAAAVVLGHQTDPSLLDIAKQAGVSRATIYRHFSDVAAVREALLDEVKELATELMQTQLTADTLALPFIDRMVSLVETALPIRTRYAEAMATEPTPDAGIIKPFAPVLEELIRQAQAKSEVRADLDPAIMSEAIIAMSFYVARKVYRDGVPIGDAMQVFEALLRGMAPSGRRV
jgi:AcrR family transcriptional regulator